MGNENIQGLEVDYCFTFNNFEDLLKFLPEEDVKGNNLRLFFKNHRSSMTRTKINKMLINKTKAQLCHQEIIFILCVMCLN